MFLVFQINLGQTRKNVISSCNNQVRYFRKMEKSSNCGQNCVLGKVHFQVILSSDFINLYQWTSGLRTRTSDEKLILLTKTERIIRLVNLLLIVYST